MICPLCETELTQALDAYFFRCSNCFALVKNREFYLSPEQEKARYELHQNDVNDHGYQRFAAPLTKYVQQNFFPSHKGLDFGSGTGSVISKTLLDRGFNIVQYDPLFAPDETLLNTTYEYIVSCEVFEHFHYPNNEMNRLTKMLKPNGQLLIYTLLYEPTIDFATWHYRNDPTHVFIYTTKTMEYIAKNFGLALHQLSERFVVMTKN